MSNRKSSLKEQQRQKWQEEKDKKKLVRHNTAANQEKHPNDWQPLRPNELGVVADRRIMPRDENGRRAGVEWLAAQTIEEAIGEADWQAMAAENGLELGVVVAAGRGVCRVLVAGEPLLCEIRGAMIAGQTGHSHVVAVGDRVLVRLLEAGRGLISQTLPRRNGLSRPDSFSHHLKQLIAVNVDQLLIVAAWREPHLWLEMIDHYLIAAGRNNLRAIICLNKIDLANNPAECEALLQPYHTLGYPLLFTSALSGQGLTDLKTSLHNQTTVLSGMSGVGKSSLLSAISPGLNLRTQTTGVLNEGRHTTTQTIMLPLQTGGYVVDTPGLREMGLAGLSRPELLTFYPDIAAVSGRCRFANCTHAHEPGCAVQEAIHCHQLAPWRLKNYQNLLKNMVNGEN